MSFRQKLAWICLIATLIVFVPYFTAVAQLAGSDRLSAGAVLGLFIVATLASILLFAGPTAALAISSRPEPEDERDRAIEIRAARIAYFVLACFSILASIAIVAIALAPADQLGSRFLNPIALSQLFLFGFVVAELVRFAVEIVSYARGA